MHRANLANLSTRMVGRFMLPTTIVLASNPLYDSRNENNQYWILDMFKGRRLDHKYLL